MRNSNFLDKRDLEVVIPRGVLNKMQKIFTCPNEMRRAKKITKFICEHYVLQHKKVPFNEFIRIGAIDFRKNVLGKDRAFLAKKYVPMLMETIPHQSGKYSIGYRFKSDLLVDGFVKEQFEIKNPVKAIGNKMDRKKDPYFESLDFSECSIQNSDLLSDMRTVAFNKVSLMMEIENKSDKRSIKSVRKNGISSALEIEVEGLKNYLDLETELRFEQRKETLLNMNYSNKVNRDETTNRLHSALTNMPGEATKYCKYKGERLMEIDMENCHYTLISNIFIDKTHPLHQQLIISNKNTKQILTKLTNQTTIKGDNIYVVDPLCPGRTLKMSSCPIDKIKDIIKFIEWSFEGSLYNNIYKLIKNSGCSGNTITSRDGVKQMLMEVFYGRFNGKGFKSRIFKRFFPNVYNIINDFKFYVFSNWDQIRERDDDLYHGVIHSSKVKEKTAGEAGKSSISILLMNEESSIFIDLLLYGLRKRGIPCFSRHDSILVPESKLFIAKRLINNKLEAYFDGRNYSLRA